MSDRQLMEKALAEDPTIDELTRWCQARESGKEDAANLKNASTVKKTYPMDNQIEEMLDTLKVMKMKKAGKFSNRNRKNDFCPRCKSKMPDELNRCPSNGKSCFSCGGPNYFSGSEVCPKTSQLKRLDTGAEDSYSATRMRNEQSSFRYPIHNEDGTVSKSTKRIVTICKVAEEDHKWVEVSIGGVQCKLFADTGSEYTIIPPELYKPEMGKIFKSDINLRTWGSLENLNIIGMFRPEVKTKLGARTETKVYIVEGFKPEPLLGDTDAQALGFIHFNKEGRLPSPGESLMVRAVRQQGPKASTGQARAEPVTPKTPTAQPPATQLPAAQRAAAQPRMAQRAAAQSPMAQPTAEQPLAAQRAAAQRSAAQPPPAQQAVAQPPAVQRAAAPVPTPGTRRRESSVSPSIPQKIRENLKLDVDTKPENRYLDTLTPDLRREIDKLVDRYKGSVFDDTRVGLMNIPPIHLDYDTGHTPIQPPFRNIPFHYQERVSKHLQFLRDQGVISDVDPRQSY